MEDIISAGVENIFDTDKEEIFGDYTSKIKLFSVTLDGVVTDFAVTEYINQVFIVITQFQKIGTLISVIKGSVQNLNGCDGVYDIKTICGLDSQDSHLAARFLSSQINVTKPILFGICLKDYQPKILKAIAKVLKENI